MIAQGGPPQGPQKANPATAYLERGQKLIQSGDLSGALEAFDAAAKAGGNTIRVQSIYFSISDPTKYYRPRL